MTPVLRPRHIPIHPKPPIYPPHSLPFFLRGDECFHALPQFIMERGVHYPVEVVREDTRVFPLRPHRRVGDEFQRFPRCDDGRAFRRRQNVTDETQVRYERVCVDGRLGRRGQSDGVVLRGEEDRGVEVGRFTLGSGRCFDGREAGF